MPVADYEPVIGLEVHVELSTATKLFCSCANEFGAVPNTNVCPVCLGLPGSLPVLNETAVEFAVRVGEAFHFDVPEESVFHRKNYFYPDMPKDYQTSQYDHPICSEGWIEVDGARIRIERAHLEEDTGKSQHIGGDGRIQGASHSLVDYNRAGVPLLEIVSHPDIRGAEQARAYASELRSILETIGVSDVKMEEGSMRVDANVSLRRVGTEGFGTKVEVKNMNSLRSLARAIDYEIARQADRLDAGESVVQETRHWNENTGRSGSMRSKEQANDYRYFPEPDLVPVAPTDELRAYVVATMPELPAATRARLVREWGITEEDARVLLATPRMVHFTEQAVATRDRATPKDIVNWATGDVLGYLNDSGQSIEVVPLAPDALTELVELVAAGTISRRQAKDVLAQCLREPVRPKQVVADRGLEQVSDSSALEAVVHEVLAAHPGTLEEFRAGDDKTRKKKRGFLMGEAMKALKGQGNPAVLNQILDAALDG